MSYVTADEVRAEIQSGVVSSMVNAQLYVDAADAASEAVDRYCFRTFVKADDTATARTFRPTRCGSEVDELDDIAVVTDLAVATDTAGNGTFTPLAADAYLAEIDNRSGMVTAIRSMTSFPSSNLRPRSIQVTARYGWPETPAPVKRAAMIWAVRLVNRRSTPTGVVAFGDYGGVKLSTIDPDVKSLLAPFRLRGRLLR